MGEVRQEPSYLAIEYVYETEKHPVTRLCAVLHIPPLFVLTIMLITFTGLKPIMSPSTAMTRNITAVIIMPILMLIMPGNILASMAPPTNCNAVIASAIIKTAHAQKLASGFSAIGLSHGGHGVVRERTHPLATEQAQHNQGH